LKQFHLQEINRWGYKPGILFYFEVKLDGKELSTVEFGTRDGLQMAHLLTDYVQALMQEAELEKSRGLVTTDKTGSNAMTSSNPPLSATPAAPLPPPPPPPPRPKSIATTSSSAQQSSSPATSSPSQSKKLNSTQYTAHHHRCATIIQSNYRGYALRNEWIREDCAILIQAVYRGYAERCRVSLMLEELFHSGQLELIDDE
jgi:hypothetical protein